MRVFSLAILLLLAMGWQSVALAAAASDARPIQLAQASDAPEIRRLIERGEAYMARHDVASARLFFELAAGQGHGEAATKLAMTYDPYYLKSLGVRGYAGNAQNALDWYGKAANRGDLDATLRLDRLQAQLSGEAPGQPSVVSPPLATTALREITKPLAISRKDIRVQLAAANSEHAALVEAVRLRVNFPGLLGDKELLVEHLDPSSGREVSFGVRTEPLTDKQTADKLCVALQAKSQDCFVLP